MPGTISVVGAAPITAPKADTFPVLAEHPLATINTDFIFDPGHGSWVAEPYDGATVFPDLGMHGPNGGFYGVPVDGAKPPDLVGKELVFAPGTKEPLSVRKAGVAINRVGEPALEGFKRHVIISVGTLAANPATGTAFISAGQAAAWEGIILTSGGGAYPGGGGGGVTFGAVGAGQHAYLAEYLYNTGANTTTVTIYLDSPVPIGTRTTPTAPNALSVNNGFARYTIGGGDGWETLNGSVRYAQREVITAKGYSAAEHMTRVLDYLAANP